MLPIILVLLFATSALAAPTVQLNLNSIDDVPPVPSNGKQIGAYLLTNAFDIIDGGEKNVNVHYLTQIVTDYANLPDPFSQASALAEAVAILNELSTGYPGDACEAANFINSHVKAMRSGNVEGDRAATAHYVRFLASALNPITQGILNPQTARFANGRRGNCQAGGASYPFEAAWDLARSNAVSADLFQEQYCAAKRLYNGFSAISRNVGAAATAAAQAQVAEFFIPVRHLVADVLAALSSGSPRAEQAARVAQRALISETNKHP